jgi:hypothetical protein
MTNAVLDLDAGSLPVEALSEGTLMRELNLNKRPSWLLTLMMNILESKRQKKGLGWSRPWNKEGLNVFRTHKIDLAADGAFLGDVGDFLKAYQKAMPAPSRKFISELLADPRLMAFVFYHNRRDGEGEHEGLTVSLGRLCAADPGKRDRLDVILEDRRDNGAVDGRVDKLRIYSCPWSGYGPDRGFELYSEGADGGADLERRQAFYERQIEMYRWWRVEPARQWNHWSIDYIDYFGPRRFIPLRSSFT